MISMKKWIAVVIAIVIIVAVAGWASSSYLMPKEKRSLTVAIWTGPPSMSIKDFIPKFQAKYPYIDIKIHYQGGAGETLAKLRAEKANPTIDIFFATESAALYSAMEGLSVPITEDKVPNLRNMKPEVLATGMYEGKVSWIPYWKGYVGIAVNSQVYDPKTITSWQWLWSKDLSPRKLGVAANFWFGGYQVQHIAKIWGGDEQNYEIGFQKLKELAPNIGLVYSSDADSMKGLISRETPAQLTLYDNVYRSVKEGAPIVVVTPPDAPVFAYYDVIVAVKNPPGGQEAQMLFINELLTLEANEKWCNLIGNEPVIKGSTTAPEIAAYVGFSKQWHPDQTIVNKNWPTWNDRWTKEIQPLLGK